MRRHSELASVLAVGLIALLAGRAAAAEGAVARGAYLANAAGCAACHTDGKHGGRPYGGGRAISTPFGIFYSPNITPDPHTGIGRWSDAQFLRALRFGVGPGGRNYYPAFPYTSFTKITDEDALAIKAYLFSLPPVHRSDRPHALSFPYSWRPLLSIWKWLYFRPGPFRPDPARSATFNRGAYLVNALAHCGECHTPRNWLGAMEEDRFLAGTPSGPGGKPVPDITSDPKTGIGKWNIDNIATLLQTGEKPDGDFIGGAMGEVVDSTARLTDADRHAIAVYIHSLPPVPSRAGR